MHLAYATTYDIFGDIHGCALTLRAALRRLGFGRPGTLQAPAGHHAVFVGDLVDRGPRNRETLAIVMELVEAGYASMVLGNHDLNFLGMRRERPGKPGRFARPHSANNLRQAEATLREAEADPVFFAKADAFLMRQPLWLENEDLRIVHACPDREALQALVATGHVDAEGRVVDHPELVAEFCDFTPAGDLRALILSGPEFDLPDGQSYLDHQGIRRTKDRLPWWTDNRWKVEPLTVFGHYAMLPEPGRPFRLVHPESHSICVDRGLGKGGRLMVLMYSPKADNRFEWFAQPDLDLLAAQIERQIA